MSKLSRDRLLPDFGLNLTIETEFVNTSCKFTFEIGKRYFPASVGSYVILHRKTLTHAFWCSRYVLLIAESGAG